MAAVAAAASPSPSQHGQMRSTSSPRFPDHHQQQHGNSHDSELTAGLGPHTQPQASSSTSSLSRSSWQAVNASEAGPRAGSSNDTHQHQQHAVPAAASATSLEDTLTTEDFTDVNCGGCGLAINEDSADAGVVHFATSLWHLECFRCAKCHEKVSTDRDDILLLSDGHPICGRCNYSCQICGLPILEEAIMTGEESYHASCFTCRSCNSRIEELVFAKTSQGIYCMPCHNERVARSRRHADNKRRTRNKDGTSRRKKDSSAVRDGSSAAQNGETSSSSIRSPQPESSPAVLAPPTPSPRKASVGLPESTPTMSSFESSAPPTPLADSGRSNVSENPPPSSPSPTPPPPNPKDSASPALIQSFSQQSHHTPSPSIGRPSGQPTLRELRSGTHPRPRTADSNSNISRMAPSPLPRPPTSESSHLEATADSFSCRGGRASVDEQVKGSASTDSHSRDAAAAKSSPAPTSSKSALPVGLGIGPTDEAKEAQDTPTRTSVVEPAKVDATPTKRGNEGSSSTHAAASDAESDTEPAGLSAVQVKRASKLSFKDAGSHLDVGGPGMTAKADFLQPMPIATTSKSQHLQPTPPGTTDAPLAGSFSFYDPDLMNLMDTFGQFDSSDGIQLSSPMIGGDQHNADVDGPGSPSPASRERDLAESTGRASVSSSRDGSAVPASSSITTLRARVRESLKASDDGRVSMDTSFIESILQELEDTKAQMKTLQHKYQRMKRASQQAAQGFSHAKTEFEQQVHAREDAELQMLQLKQQLSEQASKLTSVAKQEQRQERMANRSKDVKTSLEDMTRDLAKLTVERDMTVAEVAELIAMQDGRAPLPPSKSTEPTSRGEGSGAGDESSKKTLQSRLSVRLDGVKAKYRKEINDLTNQRDELLLEIEDLRQSRDVYLEETEALNTRNEELNLLLSKLQNRVESLTAAEMAAQSAREASKSSPARPGSNLALPSPGHLSSSSGVSTAAAPSSTKGSWFGGRSKQSSQTSSLSNHHHTSSSISSARDLPGFQDRNAAGGGGSSSLGIDSDQTSTTSASGVARGGLAFPPHQAAMARAEAAAAAAAAMNATSSAAAKKFKWMKAGAKSAGQGIASALPGVHSPPVPPKSSAVPLGSVAGGGSSMNGGSSMAGASITGGSGSGGGSNGNALVANEVVVREHLFQPFNVLRPTRCFACQKNMWGQSEVRCALCGQVCHSKCLNSLSLSCHQPYIGAGTGSGGPSMGLGIVAADGGSMNGQGSVIGGGELAPTIFGRSLIDQVASEGRPDLSSPLVPLIVLKCIQAVEANGMDFEGIYRKSGGSSQLKIITQLFERGQRFDLDDCDRFNDVSAVTSVLKNYFRELPEPLLTYELHEAFIEAAETSSSSAQQHADGDAGLSSSMVGRADGEDGSVATTPSSSKKERMLNLIRQLPAPHHDTLKVLCLHLKRIGDRQAENRMTARNLGVVFGPTLMRSRDPSREFADMGQKSITVEWLCENAEAVFGSE